MSFRSIVTSRACIFCFCLENKYTLWYWTKSDAFDKMQQQQNQYSWYFISIFITHDFVSMFISSNFQEVFELQYVARLKWIHTRDCDVLGQCQNNHFTPHNIMVIKTGYRNTSCLGTFNRVTMWMTWIFTFLW